MSGDSARGSVSSRRSALVGAGETTSGDDGRSDRGEKDTRSSSIQRFLVDGDGRGESEELENVAVWSVTYDRFGSVITATDSGAQYLHSSGWVIGRETASREFIGRVEFERIDNRETVHCWLGDGDIKVLDHQH